MRFHKENHFHSYHWLYLNKFQANKNTSVGLQGLGEMKEDGESPLSSEV